MTTTVLHTSITLGFPLEVLLGSKQIQPYPKGVTSTLTQPPPEEKKAAKWLNLLRLGSGGGAGKRFWSWLNDAGRQAGEKFLTMDLLFAVTYGGALAASLWWVWVTVGHPFHPAWIVAPLAMMLIAEWTEYLIQLAQLRQYVASDESRIQHVWIQISSCETTLRLWLTLGLYVSLVELVLRTIFTVPNRPVAGADAD